MFVVSGDRQSDTVGTELPEPVVVRVTDDEGRAVQNQLVNFRVVAGGGSPFAGSSLTNQAGEARERWTLGKVAGEPQQMEARAVDPTTGAALVFATFNATAVAGAASKIKKASADSGQTRVASAVAVLPTVQVVDQFDNPVSGTPVVFEASVESTITGANQTTNASGIATVGSWTIGTVGVNSLSATSPAIAGSVTFTAFGTAWAGTSLLLSTRAVDAASGAAFGTQPIAIIRDADGNTVTTDNTTIVTVTVNNGASLVGNPTATASSGVARFTNVGISGVAGTSYTLTFSADGLSPATQTLQLSPGPAAQLVLTPAAAGAMKGLAFETQPSVAIRDASGNTVTTDNNTVVRATVSGATIVGTETATASGGVAAFTSLGITGTVGNTYTLTFSATGISPATQSITLMPGPVTSVTVAPTSVSLTPLQTRRLNAVLKDAEGNIVSTPANWTSSNTGVATVAADGDVSAVAAGSATITVESNGHSASADVSVLPFAFAGLWAGGSHTCAVTPTNGGYCWGSNLHGELGNGSVRIGRGNGALGIVKGELLFTSLSPSGDHTCGLIADGSAYCWGFNLDGQLGDGTFGGPDRLTPVPVQGGLHFTNIQVPCALTASGEAYCWGNNDYGQIGDGTTISRAVPTPVAGGLVFTSLANGVGTCGLVASGAAYCWSTNTGDGTFETRLTPVPVQGGHVFTTLTRGSATCGLTPDGAAYCWGSDNEFGSLGDGTISPSATPVLVKGGLVFTAIAAAGRTVCALTTNGAAYCWGEYWGNVSTGPVPVPGNHVFKSLTGHASSHTCGIDDAGIAYCWGNNEYGQLGNGTFDYMIYNGIPVRVLTP
jgi:hypothetical protein